jgi:hypothetical protein
MMRTLFLLFFAACGSVAPITTIGDANLETLIEASADASPDTIEDTTTEDAPSKPAPDTGCHISALPCCPLDAGACKVEEDAATQDAPVASCTLLCPGDVPQPCACTP